MCSTQTVWFDVADVTAIFAIGNIIFGYFEAHKPNVRGLLKVVSFQTVIALLAAFGLRWVSYTIIGVFGLLALYIDAVWLPRHGVNGVTGEPKDKYYELIGVRRPTRGTEG